MEGSIYKCVCQPLIPGEVPPQGPPPIQAVLECECSGCGVAKSDVHPPHLGLRGDVGWRMGLAGPQAGQKVFVVGGVGGVGGKSVGGDS